MKALDIAIEELYEFAPDIMPTVEAIEALVRDMANDKGAFEKLAVEVGCHKIAKKYLKHLKKKAAYMS